MGTAPLLCETVIVPYLGKEIFPDLRPFPLVLTPSIREEVEQHNLWFLSGHSCHPHFSLVETGGGSIPTVPELTPVQNWDAIPSVLQDGTISFQKSGILSHLLTDPQKHPVRVPSLG